jgi:uncharacterized protein YcaQ
MWNWHDAKIALEWLFCTGRVAIAARRPTFERVYELTERVIPPTVLAASIPSKEDAQRQLIRIAAGALSGSLPRGICAVVRAAISCSRRNNRKYASLSSWKLMS